jgi:hypothetical protein
MAMDPRVVRARPPGARTRRRRRRSGRHRGPVFVAVVLGLIAAACSSSEIPGTYEVEVELLGMRGPLHGVLVLSRGILDVPAPSEADRELLGEWLDDDAIDANSCFILYGNGGAKSTPRNVELIDARFRDDGVRVPFDVYRTPSQRLEVTRLEFFASALGGEVVLHDQGQTREGRIHGRRTASPEQHRCIEALSAVRAELRDTLAP